MRRSTVKSGSFLAPPLTNFLTVPAIGSRGGLITAWNPAVLSAGTPLLGTYTLTIPFSSTTADYTFRLTNVYAPSNHSETGAFLSELRHIQPPQECA